MWLYANIFNFYLNRTEMQHTLFSTQMTFQISVYSIYGFLSIINNFHFSI